MIRLFTTCYDERLPERRAEYGETLRRNLANPLLDEIVLFHEGGALPPDPRGCLKILPCAARPTFDAIFAEVNRRVGPGDLSLVANGDIYFDPTMNLLRHWRIPEATCLALSRWDVQPDGSLRLVELGDSQDCWVFRGPVRPVRGAFPMGANDCDNKIAWELEQAGYRVINPSLSLRVCHLHLCGYRSYQVGTPPDFGIRPPFRYVEPENLADPWTCRRLQSAANLEHLPWRWTRRKFARWAPLRLLRRVRAKAQQCLRPEAGGRR